MYIEPVSRPTRSMAPSVRQAFVAGGVCAALTVLGGCNLFDSGGDSVLAKPATLQPEQDAFTKSASRTYTWDESLRRSGKSDSLLAETILVAARLGDTVIGGVSRTRLNISRRFSTGPAPAATLARLGFRPGRTVFDSTVLPDPGPGLPFPDAPALGWRLDTTVGELRFVRVLDRVETVKQSGKGYECWTFAESTYWVGDQPAAALIGAGTTWMGARGLVKHQSAWSGFAPNPENAGTLFREITAD